MLILLMPCKLWFSFVLLAIYIKIQYRAGRGMKKEMNLKCISWSSSEHFFRLIEFKQGVSLDLSPSPFSFFLPSDH